MYHYHYTDRRQLPLQCDVDVHPLLSLSLQVQENSPGHKAGLEAFFDFIIAIGNSRLVSEVKQFSKWKEKYVTLKILMKIVS